MAKLPSPNYLNLEYLFNKLFEQLSKLGVIISDFLDWLSGVNPKPASIIISILLTLGIFVVLYKLVKLKEKDIAEIVDFLEEEKMPENQSERWQEIKGHLDGENPIEWKMAIIEADSLLDDIMKRIGYQGENLGERLKMIEKSDLNNLNNIWEAHKVRNRLVHEPGKITLSKEEAKDTIWKYEKALRELKYI